MRYLFLMLIGLAFVAGCDHGRPSSEDEPVPTCREVVDRADDLAIEWAAEESPEKEQALRSVIEKERARSEVDPAVTLCEEQLSADQKRCIMSAEDLVAKNECIKGK